MSEQLSLYNPRDTPPEQLEAMLTGREPLLKEILDSLREQLDAPTRQHWLLRGPRGIGKTHLTGIIHHRVQSDAVLSKAYLPLWLGEADVYEVYSPATLLLRICERLADVLPEAGLVQKMNASEADGDEDLRFEELAGLLTEEAERRQQVLIVLMENLDALFESFAPKQRTEQIRQLRALLMSNPRFLFISTTPTRYLKEVSDPKAPLFAQLKERKLSPLKVQEVGALFTKLTQLTGRKELLGQGSEASLKQRIIHQLTGGLPRSVVMAFEILRDKEGIQVLVEDLRAFLDAQTAYFEARLSRLAPRERAIVTTLALADQNLTLKELSEKSLLPEKSLSTLVARLEQEGHVEAMEGTGGKGTLYGLSEGLFRIWYQYRKGRLLLEPLVRFLAYWYEPEELQGVVDTMKQHPRQQGMESGHSVKLALIQIEAAFQIATSEAGRMERRRIWEECRAALDQSVRDTPEKLSSTLERELLRGVTLLRTGKEQEGRVVLDEALEQQRPYSAELGLLIARCVFMAAVEAGKNKDAPSGSPEALLWVLEKFKGSSHERTIQRTRDVQLVLTGLLLSSKRYKEASSQLDDLQDWLTREKISWSSPLKVGAHFARAIHLHAEHRYQEAITTLKQVVAQIQASQDPHIQGYLIYTLEQLSKLYRLERQPAQERLALQQLLNVIEKVPSKTSMQRLEAKARLGLIILDAESSFDGVQLHQDIEAWFVANQDLLPTFSPEQIETATLLRRFVSEISKGNPYDISDTTIHALFKSGKAEDPQDLAEFFLNNALMLIQRFPTHARGWVEQLLAAELPESDKQQLRIYLHLLRLVDFVSNGSAEQKPGRVRQAIGRVTVEFQDLFKTLLSKLR